MLKYICALLAALALPTAIGVADLWPESADASVHGHLPVGHGGEEANPNELSVAVDSCAGMAATTRCQGVDVRGGDTVGGYSRPGPALPRVPVPVLPVLPGVDAPPTTVPAVPTESPVPMP